MLDKSESPLNFVREGLLTLSSAQAAMLIRDCRYKHQSRDLTAGGVSHIRILADMMRGNRWRRGEKIDFAKLGDKLIVVNGHHRLTASAKSGVTISWLAVVHECSSEAEVDELYCTFDTNIRIRHASNILGALDLAARIGITKSTATRLYNAVPLINSGFKFSTRNDDILAQSIDLRAQYCTSLQREIIAWENATKPATPLVRTQLFTRGALAVAMLAFKHQPKIAAEFWGGVSRDSGLEVGDPRHTYLRYLRFEFDNRNKSADAQARYAATAWNAFYAGNTIKQMRYSDALPIKISGTPVGR